jgi:hypothetical protein
MFFGLNDVAFLAAVSAPAPALDPDAAVYIAAVEAADTQALEPAVRTAINDFVIGCKADGIWNAIKASCILAGARTLTGALVPLVGAAPTNVNFGSGDYNRKTGLGQQGDSSKWLDTNYASNADSRQNDNHQAFYNTAIDSLSLFVLGNINSTGGITIASQRVFRNMNNTFQGASRTPVANTMYATSRNSSSSYTALSAGLLETITQSSETPNSGNLGLFRLSGTTTAPSSNLRVSFYSAGNALDLALLDARVTALINAFDAAI